MSDPTGEKAKSRKCVYCAKPVKKSENPIYDYYCKNCDEELFDVEAVEVKEL